MHARVSGHHLQCVYVCVNACYSEMLRGAWMQHACGLKSARACACVEAAADAPQRCMACSPVWDVGAEAALMASSSAHAGAHPGARPRQRSVTHGSPVPRGHPAQPCGTQMAGRIWQHPSAKTPGQNTTCTLSVDTVSNVRCCCHRPHAADFSSATPTESLAPPIHSDLCALAFVSRVRRRAESCCHVG